MKNESTVLARQREIKRRRKRERGRERERADADADFHINFPFSVVVLVIVCLFCLHNFASDVKPLFKAHPKMETATFDRLHIVVTGLQLLPLHCRAR